MEFIETALQNLSVESIIFVFVLMLAATQAWKVGTNFLATFGIKFEWLEKRKKDVYTTSRPNNIRKRWKPQRCRKKKNAV